MDEGMSLSRQLDMLEAANRRKQDAIEQMLVATHEVAQLECQLRNAQRESSSTRPLENAGSPNCIPHDWRGDAVHGQMFCQCGARFDMFLDGFNLGELSETDTVKRLVIPDLTISKETSTYMTCTFCGEDSGLFPVPFENLAPSASAGDDWGDGNGLSSPFPGMEKPWTDEKKAELGEVLRRYPPVSESDADLAGSLMTAFLQATPPAEPANKWAKSG